MVMELNTSTALTGLSNSLLTTGAIYLFLSLLWVVIFFLFIFQYRASRIESPALSIFLAVLAIDSLRTLFESVYFGLFFNTYLGVHAPRFHDILENPLVFSLPKIFNGVSGLMVLFILVFRLVPTIRRENTKSALIKLESLGQEHSRQLREQNDKLLAVQSIANLGNWETNPHSLDVLWAPETFRIFGLSPDVFAPTHEGFLSRVHPDDREKVDLAFRSSLGNTKVTTLEHRILLPDGSAKYVIERWQSFLESDGSLGRVLGTCQDVTEQKKGEILLQQSQRMDSIGQLTGGIAHDFNNLLTVVLGNSEILSRPKLKKDEIAAAANAITLSAERGSKLVARLLAFARRQSLQPEIVDLNDLIEGMEVLRAHALSENIEFVFKKSPRLWLVNVDALQMENAILNLYINARDAMKQGGSLIVETENWTKLRAGKAESEVGVPEYVLLTIRDNGVGMNRHTLEHLFEPFFSTKKEKMGSGLGLSIVYGFIKQSNGYIEVSSEIGKGSIFKLFIPRSPGVLPAKITKFNRTPVNRRTERVLIVEDDNLVRDYASLVLKGRGFHVTAVANGDLAVKVLRGKRHFDILFTDLIMPGRTSGESLIQIAKKLRSGIRILATSGFGNGSPISDQGLVSNVSFIAKPYRAGELAQKIEDVLTQN